MAYFSEPVSPHQSAVPYRGVDRVLCDYCAEYEVPFQWEKSTPSGAERIRHQCRPWKWVPIWGNACQRCGTEC